MIDQQQQQSLYALNRRGDDNATYVPTFAILTPILGHAYCSEIIRGFMDECHAYGATAITLRFNLTARSILRESSRYYYFKRMLESHTVDGIMVIASLFGDQYVKRLAELLHEHPDIPSTLLSVTSQEISSILVDNIVGVRDAVTHLVTAHQRRRIAFITGPDDNDEARQRYQGYVDGLAQHGLPLAPEFVYHGNFLEADGENAVHRWCDEQHDVIDAIIASNDTMAISTIDALKRRGIAVPREVAVIGFDDIREAQGVIPALTTIRQPLYQLGHQAATTLLQRLQGATTAHCQTIPTKLVLRRSCGCTSFSAVSGAPRIVVAAGDDRRTALTAHIAGLFADAKDDDAVVAGYIADLYDAWEADIAGGESNRTVTFFEEIISTIAHAGNDLQRWGKALDLLRDDGLAGADAARRSLIWQAHGNAHRALAELCRNAEVRHYYEYDAIRWTWWCTSYNLATFSTLDDAFATLREFLPKMGLKSWAISLFRRG